MKLQTQLLSLTVAGAALSVNAVSRPNILFCIADDAGLHMGAYGCSWVKTPGFDRVAADGLLFNNAYTPNAKCGPSRACILTGRNSWQLEEAANHWSFIPDKFPTVMEALSINGYFTGFTGKGWEPGVPREGRTPTGPAFNDILLIPPTPEICNVDYTANFAQFLNRRPADQPFCFWYGSREPHRAYEFGSGINKGGKKLSDIHHVFPFWPDNETVRTDMLDYAYEVEYFDRHLEQMLGELERRGLLDNTIVVVTSDNGMPFPRMKGNGYEYSNHLPLAIMWKQGISAPGRVIDDYVSFIDFAPTFLEAAGIADGTSGMQPIAGRSLADIFRAGKSGQVTDVRDHVLIGRERHDVGRSHDEGYPVRGIVKNGWLYLRNYEPERWPSGNPQTGYMDTDGSPTKTEILNSRINPEQSRRFWELCFGKRPAEELYHIAGDPACMHNLAEEPAFHGRCETLARQLAAELKEQGDPRMFGEGRLFDEYPVANENNRGFYERHMSGESIPAGWINPSDFEPAFPER